MFHILTENQTLPPYLINHNGQTSTMHCGLVGGQVREAISEQRARQYKNNNKLNTERLCKVCARKTKLT